MTEHSFDQRIGRRHAVDPTHVRWRTDQKRRKKMFAKADGLQTGVIVDLSISGAGIRAPSDEEIQVGDSVGIEVGGHIGAVTIRRITPCEVVGEALYGVEFSNPNAKFARWLHHQLLADHEVSDGGEWVGVTQSF